MDKNKSLKDLSNKKLSDRNFSAYTNLSTRLTPKTETVKQPPQLNKKTSTLLGGNYKDSSKYSEIGQSTTLLSGASTNKSLTQTKLKYYQPMNKNKTTGLFKNQNSAAQVNVDAQNIIKNKPNEYKRRTLLRLDTDKKNEGKLGRTFAVLGYKGRDNLNAYKNYINNGNKSRGRGFGDVNVMSKIDRGKQTRDRGDDITSTEMSPYKFHSTFRNYHDPRHVVMETPRGGEATRRQGRYNLKKNKFHK